MLAGGTGGALVAGAGSILRASDTRFAANSDDAMHVEDGAKAVLEACEVGLFKDKAYYNKFNHEFVTFHR